MYLTLLISLWFFVITSNECLAQKDTTSTTPPKVPLVEEGVCPFEYGCDFDMWTTSSPLSIFKIEGDTSKVLFNTSKLDTLYPLLMNMHIERAGIAVMKQKHDYYSFSPSDSLYILSYTGEGFYNIWYKNKKMNVEGIWHEEDLPQYEAKLIVAPIMDWWVNVDTKKGPGWLRLRNTSNHGISFDEKIDMTYKTN